MPGFYEFFAKLGVKGRFIGELLEVVGYRYVEEGDEIVSVHDTKDVLFGVMDGVAEVSIDLMAPSSQEEKHIL